MNKEDKIKKQYLEHKEQLLDAGFTLEELAEYDYLKQKSVEKQYMKASFAYLGALTYCALAGISNIFDNTMLIPAGTVALIGANLLYSTNCCERGTEYKLMHRMDETVEQRAKEIEFTKNPVKTKIK